MTARIRLFQPLGRSAWVAAFLGGILLWGLTSGPAVSAQTTTQPSVKSAAKAPDEIAPITTQQLRQLQVFGPILLNSSADVDPQTRRNAAHELLDMRVPESIAIVDEALRSRKAPVVLAAVSAMHSVRTPVPALMDAALAALPDAAPESLDPLSWILARYGQRSLQRVAELAQDQSATMSVRAHAVYVLGSFRDPEAAAALMRFISMPAAPANTATESTELAKSACLSLERLTGLSHGTDVQAWQGWWQDARQYSPEKWFAFMTQSLSDRVAQLQQQLLEQREANQHAARELFATYRDLFPALSIEDQFRRLPVLLSDRLAPVREFAINRVSILLRDSVRIPAEIQQKVAERLSDDDPALRRTTAKLLEELNIDGIGLLIAARLNVEKSPEVIQAMLEVLVARPSPAAMEAVSRWLTDRDFADIAADSIWRMPEGSINGADAGAAVKAAVHRAFVQRQSPAIMRLLALIGDDNDLIILTDALDGDDPAERAAVAEGFCRRGLRQPLIDRADDEAIYPFAVKALGEAPANLDVFRSLLGLRPTEADKRLWSEALVKLAGRLSASQILLADELLVAAPYADLAIRHDVLMRGLGTPPGQTAADVRLRVVARLAPVLIDMGEAQRAYELIEGMNGDASAPQLSPARFQAAALTGHFNQAALLENDPHAWIALMAHVARTDPATARAMRDEIKRRFSGRINEADRLLLDSISIAEISGARKQPRSLPLHYSAS